MSGKVEKTEILEKWKSNHVRIFWQNLVFWTETVFCQRPLENFLLILWTYSRYLKGSPNLVFCISEKNRDRTTHQSDYMTTCQEKWKKLRFWKNEAQNRVGIFWQNPIFWAETFFQRPLENFLLAWRTCSRYLRGLT